MPDDSNIQTSAEYILASLSGFWTKPEGDEGITALYTFCVDADVFRGFWLICDFGRELSADLRLRERGKLGKVLGGEGVQTENDVFNKQFRIESEGEAFCILTPHMMEYMLEMDRKARGETHIRFDRSGKIHIAIRREHDAFEVGKKNQNATLLRRQFV